MTDLDAKLARAEAIEQYGNVMDAKGLHARAQWARDEARRLRRAVEAIVGMPLPRAA